MTTFPQDGQSLPPDQNAVETSLFGLHFQQLEDVIERFGLEKYRTRQLWDALYSQRVSSIEEITTLSHAIRHQLAESGYSMGLPEIVRTFTSTDGTERYLMSCPAGETVETVWMPTGDGGEMGDGSEAAGEEVASPGIKNLGAPHLASEMWDYRRATICISSQVGCAVNCQFCLTAALGLKRNLTAGEIAGQVATVLNRHGVRLDRDRINLVFMGMGEPFLNYDAFMAAVRLLVDGFGIPDSRMTVSTAGISPGIERFAQEKVRPKLALSLNAPNDALRESLMPITKKWKIQDLIGALRGIPLRRNERITFEYVLLGGINDRQEHAEELTQLVRRSALPVKVNLIAWNPGPSLPYAVPDSEGVRQFQRHLIDSGIPAFLRRPRGQDIYAACGQLKRTVE
jgi:23S rRNA (adenine2503-C2)-methyltransferase